MQWRNRKIKLTASHEGGCNGDDGGSGDGAATTGRPRRDNHHNHND
jgi:hypothetical protein